MKLRARAAALAIAATGLLLAGCSAGAGSAEPKPKPEVLSASEAGGIYLDAVCPVNQAWDAADVELDRLRLTISRGEPDTRRFASAMNKVAAASKTAANDLDPKTLDTDGHVWPKDALTEVAAVQRTLTSDQAQATKVAKFGVNQVLGYEWDGAEDLGAAASAARAALGLPADGENACQQWHDQVAADEAAAKKAAADSGSTGKDSAEKSPAEKPASKPAQKSSSDSSSTS
ncbi:hypothetical protein JOF28_000024 [Leucobacter exalbidus]|uniref:Lipoprotein n=1 Tax=Leucobacter exalbidus TaxID=662960 RepID=A0A940PQP2_9MICO|nr:hypothetical protein [Leucobacter exalbidus]MBP1324792.1 hypothetical protein [Leucobacter exalbidus]